VAYDLRLRKAKSGLAKILGQTHARFLPITRFHAALALGRLPQMSSEKDKDPKNKTCDKIDDKAIRPLVKALRDSEYLVRAGAAKALGETRNPASVDPLIETLNDPHPLVVLFASRALIQITGQATVHASPAIDLTQTIDHARAALQISAITSGITFSTP